MQRKLTFFACFFVPIAIGSAGCFAQVTESGGQYPFVYYTPKDGLANSRVRSIKQDSKGRMIFSTYGGLSIYDGTRFINYYRQDGLANELINDVVEAGPDSFLIATNDQQLNTLVRGKIGIYKTGDNFCPVINRFFKSNDGSWYMTADQGLFLLRDSRFIRFPMLRKDGIDIGFYLDRILEWKNFFLLIPWSDNLAQRLILYDKNLKTVRDVDLKNTIISLAKDMEGRIWATTADGTRLVDTTAIEKGQINLLPVPEKFRAMSDAKFSVLSFDKENNAWFYYKDIIKISPQLQQQHISAKQGLEAASLTDLFVDQEGIVWIATDGNGIVKMRTTATELLNSFDQKPISISTIMSQNDTMWLFNMSDNKVYRFANNKSKSFQLRKSIIAYNLFVNGQRLYINTGEKLLRIKNKDESSSYWHPDVLKVINDRNGVGTGVIDRNGVIIQYVRETKMSYLYAVKDDKLLMKEPISYFIDQMAFDRQGKLWMATRDNHILVFTLHPEQPSRYIQPGKNYFKELPALNPRAIAIDTNNCVWIGTRLNGVYRIEFKDDELKSFSRFTTREGLTDNFVYTLTCDSNNTIWVGTQTGLDKIFFKNNQYIIGNVGKNNNFFQTVSKIVISKGNTVWALTNAGIILRISETVPPVKPAVSPPLLLTSLEVNNKPFPDSIRDFSFRQNNLSFTVAATSFIDERSIKYSYLLEGSANQAWSEALNNSRFNFNNLSSGHYTLKVKADFPEAIYPSQLISYSFTIQPPWWQTWWFRIPVGLALMALLIFIVRFYYRRKLDRQKVFLEKQQAIEKERTRIATDMHDDLGAGLSRIKFLSETIGIKKQQQLPFEEDITKIREYSHEMIDKMGEIVWALNEKNDSLSDLLSYTRSYTVEYLSQSGVECTIDSPEFLPATFVSGEFRRNIFLSVKEILHNIVKHSQANHVNISIQIDEKLCINIKDDGIGFDRARIRPYSNGLMNIEKRMKEIGGTTEICNDRGNPGKANGSLFINRDLTFVLLPAMKLKTTFGMHMSISLSIVEDLDEVREGLKQFISLNPEFKVLETFKTAEEAAYTIPKLKPDIVIMDISLPGMNGIDCIREIKNKVPQTQFMMFTVYENDEKVFEALKAGASGYLLKNTGLVQMIEALKELYTGGSPMSANIARKLVSVFRGEEKNAIPVEALSNRENEILQLLSKGLLYKEIADQLSISVSTVRQHIHKIYEKLHVQNRTEAINKAFGKN